MEETLTKVVLTRVYTSDEKKDGTKFIDRNGKSYKRVAIQTNAHGETWISCFSFNVDDEMRTWPVGQEVQILISKSGDFWNFKIPRKVDLLEDRVLKLEQWINESNRSDINV